MLLNRGPFQFFMIFQIGDIVLICILQWTGTGLPGLSGFPVHGLVVEDLKSGCVTVQIQHQQTVENPVTV